MNWTKDYDLNTMDEALSFEEYDYITGNEYLRKESDLIDWIEGKYQIEEIDYDEKEIYKKVADYEEVYRIIKAKYPEMGGIVDAIANIKPPKQGEFKRLIELSQNGDEKAYHRIVEMYARTILRMSYNESEQYDEDINDVFSRNLESLLISIQQFDSEKHYSVIQYVMARKKFYHLGKQEKKNNIIAVPARINEMLCVLDRLPFDVQNDIIELGRLGYIKEKNVMAYQSQEELEKAFGKNATENNILYMLAFNSVKYLSYESCMEQPCRERLLIEEQSIIEDYAAGSYDFLDLQNKLNGILDNLSEIEKDILTSRYGFYGKKTKTYAELGKIYKLSAERIRQKEIKALIKCRTKENVNLLREFKYGEIFAVK